MSKQHATAKGAAPVPKPAPAVRTPAPAPPQPTPLAAVAEHELLRRHHVEGCGPALTELSNRLTPDLVAAARAHGADDAEVAAQLALEGLTKSAGDLLARNANQGPGWVRAWATTVGVRKAIDQSRKRRPASTSPERLDALPNRAGATALTEMVRAEEVEALADCLGRLPAHVRESVVLHFWHDLTQTEIGALSNISQSAISQRLTSGRTSLTRCMKRKFPDNA